METYRILIEGIGSIGGVIAGKLIQAGYHPTLVTGNPEISAAINQNGIRVITPEEKFTVPARAFASLKDLDRDARFDVALLVMKAHSVVQTARDTLPFLEPETGFVVTCQIGIVEDAVADAIEPRRVVAGIIVWSGTMRGPGVVERTGPGSIFLGPVTQLDAEKTQRILDVSFSQLPASDNWLYVDPEYPEI